MAHAADGPPGPGSSRFAALSCLLIASLVLLLYGQTLSYGYVGLDDEHMIQRDHAFLRDLSNLPQAFTRDVFGRKGSESPYYRPLLTISLMIDTQLGGTDLTAFRATNLLLHLVGSCLVLCFLLALGTRPELALLLSLLFAVHPIQVLAVALVSGRNDPLLAVFALSALLLLIRFQRTGSRTAFGLHVLFFALAVFTKESALALLAIQPLLIALVLRQDLRSGRSRALAAAWLLVVAVWYGLRSAALPSGSGPTVGLGALLSNLPMIPQYMGKVLFPFNLSKFPTVRDAGYVWGALAIGVAAVALVRSKGACWRRVAFGGAWFLAFLLPSLTVAGFPAFEHRAYLPLVGFAIVAGETDPLRRAHLRSRTVAAVAIAVIAGCFALSWLRVPTFRDFDAFWTSALERSPHSRVAHLLYGTRLAERGRLDEAASVLDAYLERGDEPGQIHWALGVIRASQGRLVEAEHHFRTELEMNPGHSDTRFELAALHARTGRTQQALALWQQIVESDPRYAPAWRALLDHYRSSGDEAKAREIGKKMRRRGIAER